MGKKRSRYSYDAWSLSTPDTTEPRQMVLKDSIEAEIKFASNFRSPTIHVLVGPEKTSYHLHSRLLCERCPYFEAQIDFNIKSQSKEPKDIALKDTTCDVFDMFVEYIYTQTYTAPSNLNTADTCKLHALLYCFADFLMMMKELKELVLGKMETSLNSNGWHAVEGLQSQDIIRILDIVYAHTAERCPSGLGAENVQSNDRNDHEPIGKLPFSPTVEGAEIGKRAPSDPMRLLISRYAALQIEALRTDEDFDKIIADRPSVATDIISFLRPATSF